MADLSIPADFPLRVPQGADWPGVAIPIVAADGTPRTSLAGCTAHGAIRYRPGEAALFEWSTTPTTGQGLITFTGSALTFGITAAQSSAFVWRAARWQVDLLDPNAPPGQQEIRAGQGPIVLDLSYL